MSTDLTMKILVDFTVKIFRMITFSVTGFEVGSVWLNSSGHYNYSANHLLAFLSSFFSHKHKNNIMLSF